MHWKCCLETEWDFGDPSLGKMFFCTSLLLLFLLSASFSLRRSASIQGGSACCLECLRAGSTANCPPQLLSPRFPSIFPLAPPTNQTFPWLLQSVSSCPWPSTGPLVASPSYVAALLSSSPHASSQSSKGLDKNGMPAREDKKRKSNEELSGSSGKGKRKSLYARPLSLMGLPASSLLPIKASKLACSLLTPELMATLDFIVPPGGEGARVEGAGGSNAVEGRMDTNG